MNVSPLKLVVFFLYCTQLSVCKLLQSTRALKSMQFDDGWNDVKLVVDGELIKKLKLPDRTTCGHSCSSNMHCRSFNFCGRSSCELNKASIYSIINGTSFLVPEQGCKYFGMKRDDSPTCKEGDRLVSILNDSPSGACRINKKRVDTEWNWKVVSIRNGSMEVSYPILIADEAHGGIASDRVVMRPIKVVPEQLPWEQGWYIDSVLGFWYRKKTNKMRWFLVVP